MTKRTRTQMRGHRKRRRTGGISKNLQVRVKKLEKSVEKKYGAAYFSANCGASGIMQNLLPSLDSGTGTGAEHDRIGNSVNLQWLQLKGYVSIPSASSDVSNNIRLIIVRFPQYSGVTGPSDVLDYSNYSVGSPNKLPIDSFWKKNGDIKYHVIYDHIFKINATTNNLQNFNIRVKIPRTGQRLFYDSPTAVQPVKSRYCLISISDSILPVHPVLAIESRMTYLDA